MWRSNQAVAKDNVSAQDEKDGSIEALGLLVGIFPNQVAAKDTGNKPEGGDF